MKVIKTANYKENKTILSNISVDLAKKLKKCSLCGKGVGENFLYCDSCDNGPYCESCWGDGKCNQCEKEIRMIEDK